MRYQVRLSDRAVKDLDRLNPETQRRAFERLEQLAEAPFDPRLSGPLKDTNLRKSRAGGGRIIFSVNQPATSIDVVMIERRGQVYQRI